MKIMKLIFLALLTFLSIGAASYIHADRDPSNDSAALRISVTPNFESGIEIDTSSVNLDLGYVDMGASTQTVSPATFTILGNLANVELNISAQITGGWVFDNSQTFMSTGTNQLNAWASFTSISSATAPLQGDEYFRVGSSSGAKILSATENFGPVAVGISGSNGLGRFENNVTNMDTLLPGNKRHLWLYFRTPNTTSTTAQQAIQFQFSVRQGP